MSSDPFATWFAAGNLPELGPRRRPGAAALEEAEALAAGAVERRGLSGERAAAWRALVLLWHDHAEAAHGLVQDLEGSDAAWVHGIIHRREPDFSNARYWFHRVAGHPVLEPLADAAAPVLAAHAALPHRLIREGRWDPFAFIDAVSAATRAGTARAELELLKELQRLEFLELARHLARA